MNLDHEKRLTIKELKDTPIYTEDSQPLKLVQLPSDNDHVDVFGKENKVNNECKSCGHSDDE